MDHKIYLFALVILGILASCARPQPSPTAQPPTATRQTSPSATCTATATLTRTATPTRTPAATPTTPPTPTWTPTASPTPQSLPNNGLIAYSARIGNNWDIYAIAPGSQAQIRLTSDPAPDRDPAFSPDGTRLAFASRRDGYWNLYLRTPDGAITRLTDDPAYDGAPTWSPDGKRLAFASMRAGNLDIWTLDLGSGALINRTPDSPRADSDPAWSPDGAQIAFTSWRYGDADILVMDLPSGDVRQVTSTPDDEQLYGWRTAGELIYASIAGETQDVYGRPVDADPESPGARLTRWRVVGAATMSPDGDYLAFLLRYTHGARLLAQRIDGSFELPVYLLPELPLGGALSWTDTPAQWKEASGKATVLYTEHTQPGHGSPYDLVRIENVEVGNPWLSDRVDDSFVALRRRIMDETGRDFFAQLSDAWRGIGYDSGWSSFTSWHKTGRAIDTLLDYLSPDHRKRWLELVLEPGGGEVYFRLYLYCKRQDGSQGAPLETRPWDLTADARRALTGGRRKALPTGYYVDLTDLMAQYGWLRIAAHDHLDFHWHTHFMAVEYWHFQKTGGLLWYEAMLEVFAPERVEANHRWSIQQERGMPVWLAAAKGIPIPDRERKKLNRIAR